MAKMRQTRQPSSIAANLTVDAERREVLTDALTRLQHSGVDVGTVVAVLKEAWQSWQSHLVAEAFQRLRENHLRERDRAHRDVRDALDRLQRWIQESFPPGLQNVALKFRDEEGQPELVISSGTGRVVRAMHELRGALKGWGLLVVPTSKLPATRHPRRGRQPNPWVPKARAELKKLQLDAATITDLLWAVGLSRNAPR